MNSVDFIRDAVRTEAPITEETEYRMTEAARALHGAMGLCTEAGELMDAYKKHVFYGKPLDVTNIKEELGDVLWYVAELCEVYNFTFEELMELCIAKLRKRYPQKFTPDAALNRNLEEERRVLETSPMMKLAQGILNNETLPKLPEIRGPLQDSLRRTPHTSSVPPIVHKEVLSDSRDSVPMPRTKESPRDWLIGRFGYEVVSHECVEFDKDFLANMNRNPSTEDLDLFFFRWKKNELQKQERPEIRVR